MHGVFQQVAEERGSNGDVGREAVGRLAAGRQPESEQPEQGSVRIGSNDVDGVYQARVIEDPEQQDKEDEHDCRAEVHAFPDLFGVL